MQTPTAQNWIRLLLVSAIWGGAFIGVSVALRDLPPLLVAASRVSVATAALYALMKWRGVTFPSLRKTRLWAFIAAIALLSTAIPFSLLSWGQQHVPSAFAGMTMATVPLFVLPLAHAFVPSDSLSWRKGMGFIIGFVGAVVLVAGDGIAAAESHTEILARMACISAAICYALGSITTRRCPDVDELALATASLIIAMVLLILATLIVDGVPNIPPTRAVGAILYLGLLPTAVAYVLKVSIIRSAGPSFMSLVNYMVPIWAVLAGWLILSEQLPPQLFAALALILVGLAISQWPTLKRIFTR